VLTMPQLIFLLILLSYTEFFLFSNAYNHSKAI
jgi:hypothetical protein